jgi:hypothetical protein
MEPRIDENKDRRSDHGTGSNGPVDRPYEWNQEFMKAKIEGMMMEMA